MLRLLSGMSDCRSTEVGCRELELSEASEVAENGSWKCAVAGKDQDQVGYMACVPCVLGSSASSAELRDGQQ